MQKPFAHLHLHTGYSLKDGMNKIKPLVKRAKDIGVTALAITDHGQMFGHIKFAKACKDQGMKYIIGMEAYLDPRGVNARGTRDNRHIVLLAKNKVGYSNLIKLASMASIDGFYYDPRIDRDLLKEHSEGLIALSACLGGDVSKEIQRGVSPDDKDWSGGYKYGLACSNWYKDVFGDDFYLEVQDNGIADQYKLNEQLIKIANVTGINLVATNDAHYLSKNDFKFHDAFMALGSSKTIHDKNRKRYDSDEFYLKSYDELNRGRIPTVAIDNTAIIADKCNFELELGVLKIPDFPDVPPHLTHEEYLREIGMKGLLERYRDTWEEKKDIYLARFEYELGVVQSMGYNDYFLIVWDFVRYAMEKGYYFGPGRGSGAGSILSYALYITHIDPIEEGLLFERLRRRSLNPVNSGDIHSVGQS